ncbi:MAG: hypothetical protein EVA89_19740 [Sandaracinaceae bacterium]|nr:MAG: hypothetical protein EVA89_19740 [Sandaracinaceae bacterium]
MARFFLPALSLTLLACAQGGGGGDPTDSGVVTPPMDAATARDADAPAPDTGVTPTDDSGVRADGGPEPDAGRDEDSGVTPPDSGVTPPDSGVMTGCRSAAECDDGLYCNGPERCELGRCVAGTPAVCDDSIACTRDRCLEPSSGSTPTCDYTPDDSRCPGTEICGASGCTATCSETPCRLVATQCGCPSGQGCYLNGGTRLCATAGSAGEGASCSGVSSCTPGLICINISSGATAVNQCNRFCDSDADCVGGGSLCTYTLNDGMGGTVPGVRVCSKACDPVARTGCRSGAACHIFRESMGAMRAFLDCAAPVGFGTQGASCTDNGDCASGYACAGTPGTCLRYCDSAGTIGTAGGCRSSEACYGFATPLIVAGTEYGVCDAWP